MIPIFENAGLVGLGLIGGSLARAIKKHGIAKSIIGYTKSPASSDKALELGIIDSIAKSPAELAAMCDIIIICTPLSTYENIFKEIAPALKDNCTITDVGSLKFPVIEVAKKYLSKEQLMQFVPAHPIAGTEKTGVESGFAELFQDKKIILTPLKNTNQTSIKLVSKLWHECGSHTKILDATAHDKIYAEVSHLPQFLAYCYATLLLENKKVINTEALKNNPAFWQFSRICASDPTIWIDIFKMNKQNLAASLETFAKTIKDLNCYIESDVMADNDNDMEIHDIFTNIIPAVIGSALIKCSANKEYAGSGFKDFTSIGKVVTKRTDIHIEFIEMLLIKTQELMGFVKSWDDKKALAFMNKAAGWYVELKEKAHTL